jgi:anthranilate phosphoribosyltransferase
MTEAMHAALDRLRRREDLDADAMAAVMRDIMADLCDPAQIGALLMGLASKRECIAEIVGAARAMRDAAQRVECKRTGLLDTCGTGGSGVPRFNVSTAVALAVSACGVPVAKHGNRAASSQCGSADVLEHLGVSLDVPAERVAEMIDEIGIGFLFAQALHPAMRHAAGPRRALGFRTLFNLLGPLCNPAGATRQLLGVADPARCRDLAAALGELGSERVLVVHGFRAGVVADAASPAGIDDASTEGETLVWQWHAGALTRHVVRPADAGLPEVPIAALHDDHPHGNAGALLRLLDGDLGPYRTAVEYSGALALLAAGGGDLADLPRFAQEIGAAIDDGRARSQLAELAGRSQQRSEYSPPEPRATSS